MLTQTQTKGAIRVVSTIAVGIVAAIVMTWIVVTWVARLQRENHDVLRYHRMRAIVQATLISDEGTFFCPGRPTTNFADVSWRLSVVLTLRSRPYLPFVANDWQSQVNQEWREVSPEEVTDGLNGQATVLAIGGQGTAFDKTSPVLVDDVPPSTIVFIECEASGVLWMEPRDLHVADLLAGKSDGITIVSKAGSRRWFLVAFADGTVWKLSSATPLSVLGECALMDRMRSRSRDVVVGQYRIR